MQVKLLKQTNSHGIESYGFEVTTSDGNVTYEDVCTDRARIENLCELIKREEPEIRHIPELIDDFIFVGR